MANVLYEEKKQQVLALGRLGWPLRQIQKPPRIRRKGERLPSDGFIERAPQHPLLRILQSARVR